MEFLMLIFRRQVLKPIWKPSNEQVEKSTMNEFMNFIGIDNKNYSALHEYSIQKNEDFWLQLIKFFKVSYEGSLEPVLKSKSFIDYPWFPNLKLSFAKNLLEKGEDNSVALNFVHESGFKSETTYKQLRGQVGALEDKLKPYISSSDVLAAYMPNCPETVISMLAASALGGIFTSTSCDFGVSGVVDRFGQSQPKVLVAAASYEYNSKQFSQVDKIKQIAQQVESIEKVFIVNMLRKELSEIPDSWEVLDFDNETEYNEPSYKLVPFSSPLYIMYSSGTTGKPKCIVHSAGGTLLQHLKELGLHSDLKASKNIMYFTTCGWMMWNWLVSSLALGAKVTLYEGSPGFPSLQEFFSLIEKEKVNIFGTSPKFLKALEQSMTDSDTWRLPDLETILSTGAPLIAEQFDFIYQKIKQNVRVSSICGGTDIVGCFMLGNPLDPVYRGEIQGAGLGMDVSCFDEEGKEIIDKEGELVCRNTFPSCPIGFLNDDGHKKFKKSYFEKFSRVWHHGDYICLTQRRTVKVFGRSDATLNPGGVRIGTAEIYRQIEKIEVVKDSICVGKQVDGDVDVWLYVQMQEAEELTENLKKEICKLIRDNTTPRHVPRNIISVSSIPYTRSGKKMEMVVSKLINGKQIDNLEAVSNPESLSEFKN